MCSPLNASKNGSTVFGKSVASEDDGNVIVVVVVVVVGVVVDTVVVVVVVVVDVGLGGAFFGSGQSSVNVYLNKFHDI